MLSLLCYKAFGRNPWSQSHSEPTARGTWYGLLGDTGPSFPPHRRPRWSIHLSSVTGRFKTSRSWARSPGFKTSRCFDASYTSSAWSHATVDGSRDVHRV